MSYVVVASLFALLSAWTSSVSWAGTLACPATPIRVAFDDRGHNYFGGKGFDLDLALELRKRSGCAMRFSELPRTRIFAGLEKGQLDMAFFAIRTLERERYAWFAPYMVQKNFVLMPPTLVLRYLRLEDFAKDPAAVFGAVRGFTHGPAYDAFLASLRSQQRLYEVDSTEQLLRMVSTGRVQAVLSMPAVSRYYAQSRIPEVANLASLDWDPSAAAPPHEVMFARKMFTSDQFLAWQRLVAGMVADGTVKRTLARYLDPLSVARSTLP